MRLNLWGSASYIFHLKVSLSLESTNQLHFKSKQKSFFFWLTTVLHSFWTTICPCKLQYLETMKIYSIGMLFCIFSWAKSHSLHLYIYFACLFVCPFVSNKRQNGWTDRVQKFVWDLTWPQERFNDQNFKNLCLKVFLFL